MLNDTYDLDHSRPRKNGTVSLRVKIYRSRTDYVFVGLKIYLLPAQWDGKKIVNSITATIDNARLNNYRVSIGKVLLEIDESGETPSMQDIRVRVQAALGQKQAKPTTFYAYFEDYTAKVTSSAKESFIYALKKMRAYDPIDRPFTQITAGWLRGFDGFCKSTGMHPNGIFTYVRNIRTAYNRAIDDGVAQLNDYPFRRFKIKQERTRKRALSVEQLRQLRDYPCSESQRQYRDIFMLIVYLGGIAIGDLFHITKIVDGRIDYRRGKTGVNVNLKVQPEAMEIIERYRGKDHLLAAADAVGNHTNFTKRINDTLQSIGAPLAVKSDKSKPGPAPIARGGGVLPGLTTYWARHTAASLMAELDVPKETIAKVLGHSDRSVTDIYIRFDYRKSDEAVRKMINYINEG